MENDMDEAGICCHECRTTRQKLANYTSGGDEAAAAAAAAAGSNDTPDLSAFLEESMEVVNIYVQLNQSCLTFPTGSAQTHSKHRSMRGCKELNTPCLPFCG